jgi:nicotinamide-nucleotide amidase
MRAEILTIGDELCRGEIVDTNSSYLADKLWDLGITTRWMTSCTDDEPDMRTAFAQALGRADVVICSGGLGPTEDDLTVDVTSALAGVPPVVDELAKDRMLERFAKVPAFLSTKGQERDNLLAIQLRQVRVPTGARVFKNPVGLAPGFEVTLQGVPVICLPGVPREIYGIYDAGLEARLAELREQAGAVERIARQIYRVFGRGESQISQACRGLVDNVPGATIHYQVKFPETLVKLVVRDPSIEAAAERLAVLETGLRERLAGVLYGTGQENLVEVMTKRLLERGQTVATAESCTGGMIGELLTRLPGSSRAFQGGAIVYSNAEKTRQLGVAESTLREHGAVSEAVVREMAAGAKDRFGVDHAVAVSGIAGPDGGTPEKPVGTTWIAVASPGGIMTKLVQWPGQREQNRTLAAWWALKLLGDAIQ